MFWLKLSVFLSLFWLSFESYSEANDFQSDMVGELNQIKQEYNIPAISVAVIISGQVAYLGGSGSLDSDGNGKKVDAKTLFRVASISKLFTAQAALQLVEAGRLSLDDNISNYLPIFSGSNIKVVDLLSHVSGIDDRVKPSIGKRPIETYLIEVTENLHPMARGKFEYSDTGFNVLGAIVSEVSGKPFEVYISENILKPVGMMDSGYYDGSEGVKPNTEPTYRGAVIPEAMQRPFDTAFFPSEGLVSNTSDLASWLVNTINKDNNIFSNKDTYKRMLAPRVTTDWGEIKIGLGWQVYQEDNVLVARHPGSIRGYKSLIIMYPDERDGLVILTNSSKVPRFEIAKRIRELMLKHKI
ncbi:serine hydrolase domain-containing protein [Microbulbifer variabilis]|uniref:serine hydrolase domain-containing protein n=1 Tax=Microbulbifer variabilis TaxID=266805 RepID=UPI001CFD02FC|nr:serine hydrolase domain-containing protein [Microbulbifer variabilis]